MPRLLFFAPCEKVIMDEGSKTLSLITIMEQVEGEVPPASGENVAAAINWSAIALWLKTAEDMGKTYEQRTCVIQPDGNETLAGTVSFQITERTHRTIARIFGFPVSQVGEHTVRLGLREENTNEPWITMAEYPIRVVHKPVQSQ